MSYISNDGCAMDVTNNTISFLDSPMPLLEGVGEIFETDDEFAMAAIVVPTSK